MEPDILQDIEALRSQGASEEDIEEYVRQAGGQEVAPPPSTGKRILDVVGKALTPTKTLTDYVRRPDFGRGVAKGLAESGTSLVDAAGWVADKVAPPQRTTADLVTGKQPKGKLRQWVEQTNQQVADFYNPQGTTGKVGNFAGRLAGDVATGIAGGAGTLKAMPAGMKAAMEGGSGLKKVLALMGANAPVDVAQGLAQEEGLVLPGRMGSVAENVGFSALGSAMAGLRGMPGGPAPTPSKPAPAPAAPAAPEPFVPRETPETNSRRILGAGSPQGPAVPTGPVDVGPEEVARRLSQVTPDPEPLIVRSTDSDKRARSRMTQRRMMKSIENTAAKLERQARSNRAIPRENLDATAALRGAAAVGLRAQQEEAARLIRPGIAEPQALGALAGGAAGAAAGYTQGETPQERALNAALWGIGGAAGGGMALGFGRSAPDAMPSSGNRAGKLDLGSLLGVQHNTSEEGLKWMAKDGQMVAPSLAVMPEGAYLNNFGHSTLIGKTSLMDPNKVPVYKTDAYTPRASAAKDENALTAVLPEKWEDIAAVLRRTNWVGEDVLDRAGSMWNEAINDYSSGGGPEAAMQEVSAFLADEVGRGQPADVRANLAANDIPEVIQEASKKVLMDPYTGKNYDPTDKEQVLAHMKAVNGPDWRGQEMLYNANGPLFGATDSPVRAGRRKKLLEGYMPAVGPARAVVSPRLQSMDEMRDWGTRRVIGDGANTKKLAEHSAIEGSLGEWTNQHIDPAHTTQGREFSRLGRNEAFTQAVRKYGELLAKGKATKADAERILMDELRRVDESSGGGKIIDYAMDPALASEWMSTGAKLLRKVFDAPVSYMEAQPKRIVGLDEFAGLVIPKQKDDVLRDIASDMKLPFEEYTPGQYFQKPDSRAEVTKRFRRKLNDSGKRTLGFVAPEVAGTLGGASIGAAAGGTEGETTDERIRNALMGAMAGGMLGAVGVAATKKKSSTPIAPAPKGTPYEQALASQTAGPAKKGPLFNKSLTMLDPDGKRLWELEEAKLASEGEVKQRVSDATIDRFAKDENVEDIAKENLSKLTTSQFRALQNRIMEDRKTYADLMEQFDKGTPEQRTALQPEMDAALNRLISYDKVYNRAASEQGRGLRILSKIAAGRGTLESAMHAARKVLGVPELGNEVTDALAAVMRDPAHTTQAARENALAKVIDSFNRQPWWRAVLDIRRAGMLTAPATWAVNLTGNVAEAANKNLVVTPVAAGLDRIWSKFTGGERTISSAGRLSAGAKGARKGLGMARSRMMNGVDPENPMDELRRIRSEYVRDFKLSERDGDEAWRKTLRGGASVLQKVSDTVYGMMNATDIPFYESALAASLADRAAARASREGLKPGTPAFKDAVKRYSAIENVDVADATGAMFEAMDDTFKTQTKVGDAVRTLGPGAEYFVPFANTPTNLVRKALESTPGIGMAFTAGQMSKLSDKLRKMGVPQNIIDREVRRGHTLGFAKQLTTGAGMIMAGFMLSQAGVLTGEYTPPVGRDDAEREDAGKKLLRNQGALTIRVGDKAHSMAAFAQFAPLLAMGHALHMAHKEEEDAGLGVVERVKKRGLEVAGRAALATGRTVTEFPLMQGAKNAIEMFSGEKAGNIGTWLGREASSFIPASSAVAATARIADPVGARKPETMGEAVMERLPVLRERLAPKVGALGEVPGKADFLSQLVSPTRPTKVNTGPLYDALEKVGLYPTAGRKDEGETEKAYAARRVGEGENERALLQGLLDGDREAWRFITPTAARKFEETGDWKELLSGALSRQRSTLTNARKLQPATQ